MSKKVDLFEKILKDAEDNKFFVKTDSLALDGEEFIFTKNSLEKFVNYVINNASASELAGRTPYVGTLQRLKRGKAAPKYGNKYVNLTEDFAEVVMILGEDRRYLMCMDLHGQAHWILRSYFMPLKE